MTNERGLHAEAPAAEDETENDTVDDGVEGSGRACSKKG